MFIESWNRDLHGRWLSLLKHKDGILVTERNTFLCRINPINGESVWEVKITSTYGYLTAFENTIYYLENDGLLRCINFTSGKVERKESLNFSFLGYAAIQNDYLITGSWRGYTNLFCLNIDESMSVNWTKLTKSKKLKSFSIPKFHDGCIIQANTTSKFIWKVAVDTGNVIWKVKTPDNVGHLDLDYSFEISKGNIVMYTKDGTICILDELHLQWKTAIVHTCGIKTVKPKILDNQYIFQDSENYICSYDINSKVLRWRIYSNHTANHMPAIDLSSGRTLLGFTMSKQLIISENGQITKTAISERRYGSEFIKTKKGLAYLTKSKLKSIKEI